MGFFPYAIYGDMRFNGGFFFIYFFTRFYSHVDTSTSLRNPVAFSAVERRPGEKTGIRVRFVAHNNRPGGGGKSLFT